jgi:hypothetical protein
MRIREKSAVWIAGWVLMVATGGNIRAQKAEPPSDAELAAITERGRMLAEYDQAAWHASDAAQMANPKTVEGQRCLAKKENGRWTVVFGSLNADKNKFLIGYEAEQTDRPKEFSVKRNQPARVDEGYYLFAARAAEVAMADFGKAWRPYNLAVLPEKPAEGEADGRFFVYLYPAQTKAEVYPLGGDVRYLISGDGKTIVAKRQMHKTILEISAGKTRKTAGGYHTHVLSDEPEDTDVLHVLQQDPPQPELVATQHFVYQVKSDGTIPGRVKKK